MKHKPDYWGDDNAIRADLELEAHRETFIATLLDMLKCFRHVTDLFLRGELRLDDPHYVDKLMVRDRYFADSHFQDDKGQKHKFNKQQRFLRDSIRDYMDASLEADRAQTDEEYDRLVTQTAALRRVIAGLGVPGSGKTTVIDSSIEEGHSKRARMLYLLPTGQQAVRMRLRHPNIDVDTVHMICGFHKDLKEVLHTFELYDAVFIDEFPQLQYELWERVVSLWEATHRRVCLVIIGDFLQLPSIAGTNASDSYTWKDVTTITLHQMVRCKCPLLDKQLT